jgi:Protein of unknown function (DUF4239)
VDWLLDSVDALENGALVFLLFVAIALLILFAVDAVIHAIVPDDVRTRAAGTAAWVLSVLATIYAILAAFVIVDEYGQLQSTQQAVSDNAAALSTVSENAAAFPGEDQRAIQAATLAYANEVVDDGFPRLAAGREPSGRADRALESLFRVVQSVEPETPSQTAFYEGIVTSLDELVRTRTTLTTASREDAPTALVLILVVTGFVILVVASLLDTRHRRSHLFILGAMTIVIALSLALVVSLDRPFDGIVKVDDQPIDDFVELRAER